MKIAVLVRNVVDCRIPLPVDEFGEKPLLEGMINIVNPGDWLALDYALNSLPVRGDKSVTALSLGDKESEETLRWCRAAGAQRVLRIWDSALAGADQLGKGKTLAAALARVEPDLVLCGDNCLDQMLSLLPGVAAAAAGISYVPGVTTIERLEKETAVVVRKLEKGRRERVHVRLPAVIALVDGGDSLYPDLPDSVAAFSETVPCIDLAGLGLSAENTGERANLAHTVSLRLARPVPVRPVTPDPNLPAEQRLRKILQGGVARKQGEIASGSPEQLADRIIAFLRREPGARL